MTEITDCKVIKSFFYDEALLKKTIAIMEKNGIVDAEKFLPTEQFHKIEFKLTNSYAKFANGIRRVLQEELPVICLTFDNHTVETDDEFILIDVLLKNINLLPITQEYDVEEHDKDQNTIYLYKHNTTNRIIDVKAGDIQISKGGKNKNDKSNVKISELIPNNNIVIIRLRPGKFIKIKKMNFQRGQSKTNAAKFSLLSNIKYQPLDIEPYDIKKKTGVRSIEKDCKEFQFSLLTAGNIQPKTLFNNLNEYMTKSLSNIKDKILTYSTESKENDNKYYYSEGIEVTIRNNLHIYIFQNEYITFPAMIAQRCLILDPSIEHVSSTVERYDSEVGIIKINHSDCNKLLLQSIDDCIKDIDNICKELHSTKTTST